MDQAMMDNPVTLVIKAPNQKYDDQTINCFLDWTVEKLKTHLSKVYPSKPIMEHRGPSPLFEDSVLAKKLKYFLHGRHYIGDHFLSKDLWSTSVHSPGDEVYPSRAVMSLQNPGYLDYIGHWEKDLQILLADKQKDKIYNIFSHARSSRMTELTKDQRLVYSGKLLLDHLQLKDVLRKQDEYHMVHLVCASRTPPNSPKPSTSRENARAASTSSKSGSEHSGSASPVSTSQDMPSTSSNHRNEESLRHRHAPHTATNTMHDYFSYNRQQHVRNPIPGQGAPAVFPAYSVFSPLQMMWWQQMYARQYYMQYQAVASNQGPAATPIIHSDRPPTNPPRAAPNIAPEVNQNVQMNVQGGAVMNEEEINRDWLDWIYTVSRAAILLSIVYFYSSFSRFVMVMGAMILVYMHQAGWFPFRQEDGQPQARDNAADVNQDRVNNNELLEMERRMDEGVQEEGADDVADEAAAAPRPGIVASAWSFITTFFTSLIPEGPPQVN